MPEVVPRLWHIVTNDRYVWDVKIVSLSDIEQV